jgi:putative resolvase
MIKSVGVKEAAEILGVTPQTIRRWEKEGRLIPTSRTKGGQRRYNVNQLQPKKGLSSQIQKTTFAYARVSSHDQKADLERQSTLLELYCTQHGWRFEIISDLGSGMNYHKKGLKKLLHSILAGTVERLVLTHKDRLLRFGAELVFSLCELQGVEIVIINQGSEPSFEEELAQDVLEIITVFSARLYGSRSRKNKQLMNNLKEAVNKKS